jgi:hypothetical protein
MGREKVSHSAQDAFSLVGDNTMPPLTFFLLGLLWLISLGTLEIEAEAKHSETGKIMRLKLHSWLPWAGRKLRKLFRVNGDG